MKVLLSYRQDSRTCRTFAGEVLPSAACWPTLGNVSINLFCSQRAQINRQARLSGSHGPSTPQRERIIPPFCRPRYHRSSNKTSFHTQTPRGGRLLLITLWLRGQPSCPCCQWLGTIQPSPRPVVSLVLIFARMPATSPVFKPATENLQLQQ